MTDEKRKSFEKWARLMAISVRRMHGDSGDYEDADTRNAWHAWRNAWHASALAMRERAASIADDAGEPDRYKCYATGKRIAERIRAMGDERAREIE